MLNNRDNHIRIYNDQSHIIADFIIILYISVSDFTSRLDSVESSITTLNTKSTTLGVTLQTICDRIDNSYDGIEDASEKYSCCFNPDNQLMICATQTFIGIGAIAITPGAAGDQCLATDLACQ